MAITEQQRHDLYEVLQQTLGPPHAETLMQYLPTAGFADLATKADVLVVKTDVLGLKRDLLSVKGEITGVEERLRAEMRHMTEATDLKLEAMDLKLEGMEHRILGTMRQEMRIQLLAMVGIAIALAGLILRFG